MRKKLDFDKYRFIPSGHYMMLYYVNLSQLTGNKF